MKKLVSLILALLLALAALGCAAEAQTAYPLTVQNYNRERQAVDITFDRAPERIVVGYQDNIEILLKLGLADRIVCAFGLDEQITGDLAEEFAKIPYYETRPSKEEVIDLDPDIIVGWYSLFADDRLGDVAFWNERGTGTYMAINSGCLRPEDGGQTIECEMRDILNLGAIFDKSAEAQAIVDEMQAEIDRIGEYVASSGVEPLSVAVLEDEGDSFRVYGANTIGGNVALRVGAELAVGAQDSEHIGAEDLIAADPDKIFMIWYEGYITPEQAVASILDNPAYASLRAVQSGDVYPLNLVQVYCPGLHTLEGIQTFASALYPELYQ